MSFDRHSNLYYDIKLNDEKSAIGGNLQELALKVSLFKLFPEIRLAVVNKDGSYMEMGNMAAGARYTIKIGNSEDSTKKDTDGSNMYDNLENYLVSTSEIIDASETMEGKLLISLVHKKYPSYYISSTASSYTGQATSAVVQSIVGSDFQSNDIETTSNTGTFIKPSNQSKLDFLEILKNRSSSNSTKMFMWVDEDNKFHFRSLSYLLNQNADIEIDLRKKEMFYMSPSFFSFHFNGIRYSDVEKNTTFKTYRLNIDGSAQTETIQRPSISAIGGSGRTSTFTSLRNETENQNLLIGIEHGQLPQDYLKSIYYSKIYPFPIALSFRINYHYQIRVGKVIKLIFPKPGDKAEDSNDFVSGTYLVVSIEKKMYGKQYIMQVQVVSNAIKNSIQDKLISSEGVP